MITQLGERSRIWVEHGFTSSTVVLYSNPPNWNEMHAWWSVPLDGHVFIDVGANVGIYSLLAAERGAHVIAIEPDDAAFARLIENAELNNYPIEAIHAAATDAAGEVPMTGDRDTLNRIAASDNGGELVRAVTIDDVLGDRRAAGMKIDVEGVERLVIQGARRALCERRIGLIQLEWNRCSEAVLGETREPTAELLVSCGYELLRPDEAGVLHPVTDWAYGADVFARPALRSETAVAGTGTPSSVSL